VACLLARAAPASAQYGETAEVERVAPATNSLDATAAGSEISVRDRVVAQTSEQLLQEASGTRVVGSGAQGMPFCLRIRGAACDQVSVMLDDVPLSSPDTGAFDLSLVPLEAIDGFEVFRGGAPAWLNDGSVGGVLRLRPRSYEDNEVGGRGTFGSFGTWNANAYGAAGGDKVDFFGTAGAAGARNDFSYVDDNGTILDPSDDVERQRANADFLQGFGFANLGVETSDHSRLKLVFLGLGRERGEPGPASSPALRARARETRLIGSASWLHEKKGRYPYRLQVAANYDFGRNRLDDELGEIGTGGPTRSNDKTHAVFGRIASSVLPTQWFELTSIVSARYQAFDPANELSLTPPLASDRVTAAGTIETRFFGELGKVMLELRPSVRLAWTRAEIRQTTQGAAPPPPPSSDFFPTYRVGLGVAPLSWLGFRASVSSGYKLPSLLQLFGNRSTVVPSPNLVAERALSVDGGVTARGRAGVASGYASVGAFVTWVDDMIRFRRTAQSQVKYENISSGRSRGVEVELRGQLTKHFVMLGDLTWTDAIDESTGNRLPGQPEWIAFVQPEAHSGELSKSVSDLMLFFRVLYLGDSFADPANLVVLRARTELSTGLGVDMFERRLGLSFRVDDLLDARGQDLLGYPLPGRRYTGRISIRHAW
jgi:iron complex outermembrane receptor protein